MVMLYKAKDVEKLKSQHQKELNKFKIVKLDQCKQYVNEITKLKTMNKVLGFRFNNVVKAHKIVVKELSECREDNIKLTREIQEQDKELSNIRLRILDRLGFDITDLKEKKNKR